MTDPEPVAIEFELTPEEWAEASLAHSSKSPLIRDATRNVQITLALIVVCLALLGFLEGSTTLAMMFLLAGAVGVALSGPALRAGRRKQTLKYARAGLANGTFGPHRIELRPEGLLDHTEGYEWLTRWSAIERIDEVEGSFLIYTGPNAVVVIPHTAFPDVEALRRFGDAFHRLRGAPAVERLPEAPADA